MPTKITNMTLQAIPIDTINPDGSHRFNWLQSLEVINVANSRVSQYLTDLSNSKLPGATSSIITMVPTSDPLTANYGGTG